MSYGQPPPDPYGNRFQGGGDAPPPLPAYGQPPHGQTPAPSGYGRPPHGHAGPGGTAKVADSPRTVHPPAMHAGALMKCQQVEESFQSQGQTETVNTTICVWADYSTVAYVIPYDMSVLATGGGTAPSLSDAADLTATVRNNVEVPAS